MVDVTRLDLGVDLTGLCVAHVQRLQAVDPLLPDPVGLAVSEDLLVARAGDSVAAGSPQTDELDPDSLDATWGALRRHALRVRVAGPDPAAALDALLDRWEQRLAATVVRGDRDTAALVSWASRDTAAVLALLEHGFVPAAAIAIRTVASEPERPPSGAPIVRLLREDDLDRAVPLYQQVIEFDARFGMLTERPSTPDRLRGGLVDVLGRGADCAWVAEHDGALLGLCYLDLPDHAQWIQPFARPAPIAYLGCLVVDREVRGRGVGTALVAEAHRAVAAAGVAATLLHHAVPNPLSTPFWPRHGYRPLWTIWQRRPAVR